MKAILIMVLALVLIAGCSAPSTQPATTTGQLKQFTMTAKQFAFDPAQITVNKGDKVKITITSADVAHGFALPDFGINQPIPAGQTVTVEFTAGKAGTFKYFCNVPCGPGHQEMAGTLTVV